MREIEADVLVVGSGPGGATSAAMLAEAGHGVAIVEEGQHLSLDSAPSYSLAEMDQKYRNGGLNTTFGKSNVTYIEGRCVGGASEINAGLYHRPKPETLRDWQLKYQIEALEPADMEPHFSAIEREMHVSTRRDGVGPASERLKAGADRLGWRSVEIPRFWRYDEAPDGTLTSRRQSMTETMIPRALAAGARLLPNTRIHKLSFRGAEATGAFGETRTPDGRKEPVHLKFRRLVLAAGAVQTPLLLRRSGLSRNIGDNLRMHPMIRIAARFPDAFNDPTYGVPVHQIEEFKPNLTLGCSNSSLPHLALWLTGDVEDKDRRLKEWKNLALFYVAAVGVGRGRVRAMPLVDEPFVWHDLQDQDLALLGEGLYRLGELVFAAGAVEIYNPIEGRPPIRGLADLREIRTRLPHGRINISTIHLFSSCPMGEDLRQCAVDSFGRLHGKTNVWIQDASILPLSPGVNPQGTLMAVVRRNVLKMLHDLR